MKQTTKETPAPETSVSDEPQLPQCTTLDIRLDLILVELQKIEEILERNTA